MIEKFNRKYGFNVFHQSPEERIGEAASHGLNHIEINLSQKELSLKSFTPDRISKLHEMAKANAIQLSLHIPYFINIADILTHVRKSCVNYLVKAIHVAAELNVTHITLHLGSFFWFPVEQWERKKALKRFLSGLGEIVNLCEEKSVTIALENVVPIPRGSEYYLLGDNINDFSVIFSSINSECVKFCLDTGHANMAEGVMAYLRQFHGKLACLHYHDNNGSNDEHLPVGQGNVPWSALAAELININYTGPIISECRNVKAYESAHLLNQYFIE